MAPASTPRDTAHPEPSSSRRRGGQGRGRGAGVGAEARVPVRHVCPHCALYPPGELWQLTGCSEAQPSLGVGWPQPPGVASRVTLTGQGFRSCSGLNEGPQVPGHSPWSWRVSPSAAKGTEQVPLRSRHGG